MHPLAYLVGLQQSEIIVLGYTTEEAAKAAVLRNYPKAEILYVEVVTVPSLIERELSSL